MCPVVSACALVISMVLAAGAPVCTQHGWADAQAVRDKIEQIPRFGAELRVRQPGIWMAAQDPSGYYLRVKLRLDGPCVLAPGCFRATTRDGKTLVDTGTIIAIGDPQAGRIADARSEAVRVGPEHSHKGSLGLLVRFSERKSITRITYERSVP